MSTRIPFPLPLKGVSRNFARGGQPETTCWDALNVFPFDRQGRFRPALRGGAGKSDDLETDAPVRLLHVASYATTPGGGSTTLFSQPFNQFDGSTLESLNGGSAWKSLQVAAGPTITHRPNAIYVSGATANRVRIDPAEDDDSYIGKLQNDIGITAGSDYDAQISIHPPTGDAVAGLVVRMDRASSTATSGILVVISGTIGSVGPYVFDVIDLADLSTEFITPQTLSGPVADPLTIRVAVRGNNFEVFFNDVSMVTFTTATYATQTGVGFLLDKEGTGGNGFAGTGSEGLEAFLITAPGVGTSIARSAQKLIAVSGTDIFIGEPFNMAEIASDPHTIDDTALYIGAATLFGKTYIVDGSSTIFQVDLATSTYEVYAASAGTAPTGCTIAVSWRGRLVLSGSDSDPQNFFCSRSGDPTDWDYSQTDEGAAFAGNASKAGQVGSPILALIPLNDTILIIGCDHEMWKIEGDPAAGGSIMPISNSAGIVGPKAWAQAADGSLYFIGPNGLYRLSPTGTDLTEISRDSYRQFFTALNRDTDHVNMMYDPSRYGLLSFVTPENQADAPDTSIFYDARLEGFWPFEFTHLPVIGPLSCEYWDGQDSTERYPVMGAYDGSLYVLSFVNRRDNDGIANQLISGYVVLGPVNVSDIDDAIMTKLDITGGEVATGDDPAVWNMDWTLNGGQSAFSVTEGSPLYTASGTFPLDGRESTRVTRVRGGWFTLRIGNEVNDGDYFTLEQITGTIRGSGRQRAHRATTA